VHESADDIARVQATLDRSYAAAGPHLRSIHTEQRRMTAADLVVRLQGMCLLVLATVSSAGRPVTGPVDGVFHRGSFCFGTSPDAVRWRHLRANPAVSATHLPSEDWAVIVHGTAVPADVSRADPDGLRATLLEVYTPRYGGQWADFLDSGPVYARIEADRIYALDVAAGASQYSGDDQPNSGDGRPTA
jgi:Pyridoxamine 5'-phosphate oxidase